MLNLIAANALAASRLYKRIMRNYCYQQIYEKKKHNMGVFKLKNIDDSDLFIDFKLDLARSQAEAAAKDHAIFDLV